MKEGGKKEKTVSDLEQSTEARTKYVVVELWGIGSDASKVGRSVERFS